MKERTKKSGRKIQESTVKNEGKNEKEWKKDTGRYSD